MSGGMPEPEPDLHELVSHPYVVEVLDALSRRPMALADLRSDVPAAARQRAAALRIVAAWGLVARTDNGSWDTDGSRSTVYHLTDRGRRTVATLSSFSAWTSMFDSPDSVGALGDHS